MEETRAKWDAIYREGRQLPVPAARVLDENRHLLPAEGEGIDVACGLAGNALLLARRGLRVHAWDISPVAIDQVAAFSQEHGLSIQAAVRNLEQEPPLPESADVIVVAHFLDRGLFPHLVAALRPGGLLFYQTYVREIFLDRGPKNPAWRLGPGELLALCRGLQPLVYREEGMQGDISVGMRDEAMIVARRPADQ